MSKLRSSNQSRGIGVQCEIVNFIKFYLSSFADSRTNEYTSEKRGPGCLRIIMFRLYTTSSSYASHFQVLSKSEMPFFRRHFCIKKTYSCKFRSTSSTLDRQVCRSRSVVKISIFSLVLGL